jgi:PIN domain nuclease of toxin-antitoxin system
VRLLLDTHVFLWTLFAPEKLSRGAARAIQTPDADVAVSVVTFWEISLKFSIGKIELSGVCPEDLPPAAEEAQLAVLDLSPQEAASFHRLPGQAHKDPFDRLLIWQAIQRKLVLVTRDRKIHRYNQFGLTCLW